MSSFVLILSSLWHHRRINFAIALGVAAATAVLTGALLVGDSVRGSLRDLTLQRLGEIDEVLVLDRFFGTTLVDELRNSSSFQEDFDQAEPAVLFPHGTIELQVDDRTGRSSGVLILGSGDGFWDFDTAGVRPKQIPGEDEIVLNQQLADDLGAKVGDEVIVRLPKASAVPADSTLGDKEDRIRSVTGLRVIDIVPAEGLGRFSLRASQSTPRNAFVSMTVLQEALEQEAKANAIFVAATAKDVRSKDAEEASRVLPTLLTPTFEDYGLSIKHVKREFAGEGDSPETIFDYFTVTTDRMVFTPEVQAAAERAFVPFAGQGVFTYVANTIQAETPVVRDDTNKVDAGIPYSMITALDFGDDFPLVDVHGAPIEPLGDNEIVLTSWAANDQLVEVGDRVRVDFFEAETTHGDPLERSVEFYVKAITPLTEPSRPYRFRRGPVFDARPTLANDPDLTPEVAGVTDAETIDNWEAPFPVDYSRIQARKPRDDNYWKSHRTTPKAFISLAAGQKLWRSRFGEVTSFRIPAGEGVTEDAIKAAIVSELRKHPGSGGFDFIPVKRRQLEASSGTTPFDGLFFGLSFFIIAAALMLVMLLFSLGVEQRADELGVLLAVGLHRRRVAKLFLIEGAGVAEIGAFIGVLVGVGYAWLMLAGLRTFWVGAITSPFLEFHWTFQSLILGFVLGFLVSLATIWWAIRRTKRLPIRRLLAGQASEAHTPTDKPRQWLRTAGIVMVVMAAGLSVGAVWMAGMPQAGAFVTAGALLLSGLLLLTWVWLRQGGSVDAKSFAASWALARLATRSAGRNPSRSAITIGLMATASFLIVAMSSFRLAPTEEGAGGFDLLAESSEPIFENLNTSKGRDELLADQASVLDGGHVFGLRFKPGDDASCNNLYVSSQPRVLGMTSAFIDRYDRADGAKFRWMMTSVETPEEKANPWRLLTQRSPGEPIPVVIDMNTAMYSLKPPATLGSKMTLTYDENNTLTFRVVGLLENSVLQGSLLISEDEFREAFREVSGYRYFLIESPAGKGDQVTAVLEERLSDQGFDVQTTRSVLEELFKVQNTYLSTFQSLGALGLLLGTFGLIAVQMRNVLERRGELALLRATGFRHQRLARMVLLENVFLLVSGLALGTLAALVAVIPHKIFGDTSISADLLRDLAITLAFVLLVGLLASGASIRAALRTPVLAALRGE